MVQATQSVIDGWKGGERYDMYREMRALTLRISSTILFSHDPAEASTIGTMLEEWQRRNFSTAVWLLPVNLPGTAFRRLLKHAERLEQEILSMVQRRRANPGKRRRAFAFDGSAR